MKTSRAYTGMLSSENADFKFYKKHEKHTNHVHHSSRARGAACFISPNQSVIDQKHERKSSHRAV